MRKILYPMFQRYIDFPEYLGFVTNVTLCVTNLNGAKTTFNGIHINRYQADLERWEKEPIFDENENNVLNYCNFNNQEKNTSLFFVAQLLKDETWLEGTYYFSFEVSDNGNIRKYHTKAHHFQKDINEFRNEYNFLNT